MWPCLFILYVIVCKTQIPIPSLSYPQPPLATTILFSINMFLFHRYVHLCHILDSTCKWYHTVFVFLFLASFNMIISRSIHVAANGIILFLLWLSSIPLCAYSHWDVVPTSGYFWGSEERHFPPCWCSISPLCPEHHVTPEFLNPTEEKVRQIFVSTGVSGAFRPSTNLQIHFSIKKM